MTDQEASILLSQSLQIIRDSFHWGIITIELREGVIHRINLTVKVIPKKDERKKSDFNR